MKRNIIFAVLVALAVALGQTLGIRGTTYVLLHVVAVLYIFALMNSSVRPAKATTFADNKIRVGISGIHRPAA